MRKAFNFFRSYYEVGKELDDKDRLKFYDALLSKQFENIDLEIKGMAKFAYLSQKHSIDSQIKGYFDKTKDENFNPLIPPTVPPCQPPAVQEKEKEKEEVQYVVDVNAFLNWFNNQIKQHKGVEGKFKTLTKTDINNLKNLKQLNYTQQDWLDAFKSMYNSEWVQQNKMCNPPHFLRNDNFQKYLNQLDQPNQPKHDKLVTEALRQIEMYKDL